MFYGQNWSFDPIDSNFNLSLTQKDLYVMSSLKKEKKWKSMEICLRSYAINELDIFSSNWLKIMKMPFDGSSFSSSIYHLLLSLKCFSNCAGMLGTNGEKTERSKWKGTKMSNSHLHGQRAVRRRSWREIFASMVVLIAKILAILN